MEIRSYPKILALGHARLPDMDGFVFVQEKYDGSQLSWMWNGDGQLFVKSKGKMQFGPGIGTDKMFNNAVSYLLELEPICGVMFRGEYFTKPKHNTLAYDRMPENGIMLYDAESVACPSAFYETTEVEGWAKAMGLEVARSFYAGEFLELTPEILDGYLASDSTLGGVKIEGIVIKNYTQFTPDGKVAMAKYVSEKFKEMHGSSWKDRNPTQGDVLTRLLDMLNTEARFAKAVQYLRDNGELKGEPADIGPLMKRVKQDTLEEEQENITTFIMSHFAAPISRGIGRGLPEWYKEQLMIEALGGEDVATDDNGS